MQAKIFSQDQHGIPVHWEVEGEDVSQLTGNVSELLDWLDVNLFVAHFGFGTNGHQKAETAYENTNPTVTANQEQSNAVVCPNGHTDLYDNRASKRGNQPDYRCKKCKYGGWIKDDGEINWLPPRS